MNFSVIIPTCNRSKSLLRTLSCFEKMSFSQSKYEIIVVDNGDHELHRNKIMQFQKGTVRLKYVREKQKGPSFARNRGAQVAKYQHLIFCDDDCIIPSNFLTKYEEKWLENPEAKMIGGKVLVKKEVGELSESEKKILLHHYWCFGLHEFGMNKKLNFEFKESLSSSNMSYKKENKEIIFNTKLGIIVHNSIFLGSEDFELSMRTMLSKKSVLYFEDIAVINLVTQERFFPSYLKKRYWNYGIESFITDTLLTNKFHNFTSNRRNFFQYIKRFFFIPPYSHFFFCFHYRFITIVSYFFNGKYFL